MYYLYVSLVTLLLPVVYCQEFLKVLLGFNRHDRLQARFGRFQELGSEKPLIWIHAVSVGEVHACKPLVTDLLHYHPNYQVMITTVTATGADTVKKIFSGNVIHRYIPLDFPIFINQFLVDTNPAILIVIETEIWPVLFYKTKQRQIPVIIANARLSEKSYKRYQWVSGLTRFTLGHVDAIAAQSELDANRFRDLTSDPEKVSVMGNIKFDAAVISDLDPVENEIIDMINGRSIIIAASTHDGEDVLLLKAFNQVDKENRDVFYVIVPRHPHRSAEIMSAAINFGFSAALYSRPDTYQNGSNILVVDEIGKLVQFYNIADIVFVGGSLVPVGGHNMLEPAYLSLPLMTGKHVWHFHEIYQLLNDGEGIVTVEDEVALSRAILGLLKDEQTRETLGKNANKVVLENLGASQKLGRMIDTLLAVE